MFDRQFGLLVMAVLLLSPSLAQANDDDVLSIGNVRIQTTRSSTSVKTPNIQVESPRTAENRSASDRTNRRNRTSIRRGRNTAPSGNIFNQRNAPSGNIFNQRVEQRNETVTTTDNPSIFRNSTTRSSGNGSESVTKQSNSVSCSGGSSVHQSSSTTVNGQTVHSESNCP
jgi:hypothetical protein